MTGVGLADLVTFLALSLAALLAVSHGRSRVSGWTFSSHPYCKKAQPVVVPLHP